MKRAPLLLAACAALQLALGGCVAAVVPVVAGGLLAKKQADNRSRAPRKGEVIVGTAATPAAPNSAQAEKAQSPREKRRAERQARKEARSAARSNRTKPTAPSGEPLPSRIRPIAEGDVPQLALAGAGGPVALTGLSALPTPGSAPGAVGAPFPAFARYALVAAQPKPGQPFRSALTDPATLTTLPVRQDCAQQPPAVVIDLDPGKETFDLDNPPAAAPGLAEQLAALRGAGLTILWAASLPVDKSERLYATLAATGLDTDRTDRLLLLRKKGERKQARRLAAARDWCIVAIAGDSKADFEEAFDYLRDPSGPIAQALGTNLGDGWFLTPQPID